MHRGRRASKTLIVSEAAAAAVTPASASSSSSASSSTSRLLRKRPHDSSAATCILTSCVLGSPCGQPLLLSPLSPLPGHLAAASVCGRSDSWGNSSGGGAGGEARRLVRDRVEGDVLQLKATLKAFGALAKEGARQAADADD